MYVNFKDFFDKQPDLSKSTTTGKQPAKNSLSSNDFIESTGHTLAKLTTQSTIKQKKNNVTEKTTTTTNVSTKSTTTLKTPTLTETPVPTLKQTTSNLEHSALTIDKNTTQTSKFLVKSLPNKIFNEDDFLKRINNS
ncbi:unnamed protein product [Brachionus calyciflorus]|uniref:Uncharacterized protein n=1 Tax=Brachionus calyciflorus TaxID=104777 RepID=A0A814K0I1_9BILA|nr:unnamed protein product [Brachionus calyciflorus]